MLENFTYRTFCILEAQVFVITARTNIRPPL
jgi:hypothetical protein